MAILSFTDTHGSARQIRLPKAETILGRSPECDLVIDDAFVSRKHVRVVPDSSGADAFVIHDLDSKNGTWVNGEKLGDRPRRLVDGDRVAFGKNRVTVTFSTSETTLTLTAEPAEDLHVDVSAREAFVGGRRVSPPFSRKEFDLLTHLWRRRGEACSRDNLAAYVWPERSGGDVSDAEIEQYVRRLRLRLETCGGDRSWIVTLRGFGYKLV